MHRRLQSLFGGVVAAAVVAALVGAAGSFGAGSAPVRKPVAKPVPSLTPAATEKLWRKLVAQPRLRSYSTTDCRPLRAVFYAGTDWLRLATKLAANASPCAQYYISVPPLVADKTQPRADQAWRIRALGPAFHALAEINVTGWSGWVSTTGNTWYDAGVEARRRMHAAGYDVTLGDTWALNELSSAVRQGAANARPNMRAFIRGLYTGDGALPTAKGPVFITGMSQATGELSVYQSRLQDWYEDAAFWNDMSSYVSDWSQELYGDVRNYAVAGATADARRDSLNEYLQHETALARVAPAEAAAARSFLDAAYNPLANAAWQYDAAFGWTNVTYDLMQDYVSAQAYAARYAGNSRFGFAWAPKNLTAMVATDFTAQTDALLVRLAAAIADSAATPAAACGAEWCNRNLDGAAFNNGWQTFATWKPSQLSFTTAPQTLSTVSVSAPLTVEQRTSTGIAYTAGIPVNVALSSSSAGGSFASAPEGPWSPTLTTSIASASSTVSFYYRDTQQGSAAITAAASGKTSAVQTQVVTVAADTTAPETTITAAPSGTVASGSASISFGASETATFECSLDGAAFAACASPVAYSGLADGAHSVDVRAIDSAGNSDATPARATWSIDTTAPETTISSAPSGTVASTSASFSFAANDAGPRFECSVDGAAYAACASPASYSSLGQGSHTFSVRAVDGVGNADATPAVAQWTVDTVAPDTRITSAPASTSYSRNASFSFASTETGGSFQCSMDGGSYVACASPRSYYLSKGWHTFRVRSLDAVGNLDASPASYTGRIR